MAKLRFVANEPHDVPLLGRTVEPDELVEISDDVYLSREWPSAQWDEVEVPKRPDSAFDPKDHNVEEVLAYLADADEDERTRVLALEADGKGRAGIANFGEGNV